jgi:hypothetical protein
MNTGEIYRNTDHARLWRKAMTKRIRNGLWGLSVWESKADSLCKNLHGRHKYDRQFKTQNNTADMVFSTHTWVNAAQRMMRQLGDCTRTANRSKWDQWCRSVVRNNNKKYGVM